MPNAAKPPVFKFHLQPGQPAVRKNNHAAAISPAGEGMGLQVFPGSMPEVMSVSEADLTQRH